MIISLEFNSSQSYIKDYIFMIADFCGIKINSVLQDGKIKVSVDENDKNFENFLKKLEELLPLSLFMGKLDVEKGSFKENENSFKLPRNLGLCKRCIEEMFDPSSRRYYYPFTFCNGCGFTYAFVTSYPYKRENSLFFPFAICEKCKEELKNNPFRKDFPLISCSECNVPIRIENRKKTKILWANDTKEYKDVFSLSALAVSKGERVLIKTFGGYKIFRKEPFEKADIFITDANRAKNHFLLLKDELKALFSMEKPKIKATLSDENLQKEIGSVQTLKAPDCGMSVLFAKECQNLGIDYLFYKECDADEEYDLIVDFDLPINRQEEIEYFINKKYRFFSKGDRALYPKFFPIKKSEAVEKPYAALRMGEGVVIDKIEMFDISKNKKFKIYGKEHKDLFSILSVLAEHKKMKEKSVGIYFANKSSIILYDGEKVKRLFEFGYYENILEEIRILREGSNRLVDNFKRKFSYLYDKIADIKGKNYDPFYMVAILLEIEGGFEGVSKESLNFAGKGGVAVDCRVSKNGGFDFAAFFASIMSYKLAGAEKSLIAYSVFESLGDFLGSLLNDLRKEVNVKDIVIAGEYFANAPFFSRFQRHMLTNEVLTNKEFAIDKNNIIFGELFG